MSKHPYCVVYFRGSVVVARKSLLFGYGVLFLFASPMLFSFVPKDLSINVCQHQKER
jgi:hypothetical protein